MVSEIRKKDQPEVAQTLRLLGTSEVEEMLYEGVLFVEGEDDVDLLEEAFPDSLAKFRASNGWSVGADASVAVIKAGANGMVDATTARGPVAAFVLTNAGLMADLALEGTKITRLES